METPEHERRQVIAYLRSQSGDEFEVEHVEKLTTEHVMGMQYDVWDAHTNEGRWWVITNPTNLYDQTQIKSMDVALSFHIGLTSRVRALHSTRRAGNEVEWALEVFRRLGIAEDALNRAKEVEDFQAVGMRLRETLLSATMRLDSLGLPRNLDTTDVKLGDFKARVALVAGEVASGRGAKGTS